MNDIKLKEEAQFGYKDSVKETDRNMVQLIRSLPMRVKITLFIVVTILFFYISYDIGDYTAFIAYLCSTLAATIIRRLKAER